MALTGQMEIYRIDTQAQRLLAFSWAFWVLIITAAYTANLASFFVTQSLASGQVATIPDAVALGKSICVVSASVIEGNIRAQFPTARLVSEVTVAQTYQNLKNGKCDLLGTALGRWRSDRKSKLNLECDLSWNGIIQLPVSAGISLSVTSFCYAVIWQVVDFHMAQMVLDGALDTLIDKYESVDLQCSPCSTLSQFRCFILTNELFASSSPFIRYIDRFATHSCPNENKITASAWAASSTTSGSSTITSGGTASLRFTICMLYPNEGRSLPCFCLLHAVLMMWVAFSLFMVQCLLLP
jgi:hypothetical protein